MAKRLLQPLSLKCCSPDFADEGVCLTSYMIYLSAVQRVPSYALVVAAGIEYQRVSLHKPSTACKLIEALSYSTALWLSHDLRLDQHSEVERRLRSPTSTRLKSPKVILRMA